MVSCDHVANPVTKSITCLFWNDLIGRCDVLDWCCILLSSRKKIFSFHLAFVHCVCFNLPHDHHTISHDLEDLGLLFLHEKTRFPWLNKTNNIIIGCKHKKHHQECKTNHNDLLDQLLIDLATEDGFNQRDQHTSTIQCRNRNRIENTDI